LVRLLQHQLQHRCAWELAWLPKQSMRDGLCRGGQLLLSRRSTSCSSRVARILHRSGMQRRRQFCQPRNGGRHIFHLLRRQRVYGTPNVHDYNGKFSANKRCCRLDDIWRPIRPDTNVLLLFIDSSPQHNAFSHRLPREQNFDHCFGMRWLVSYNGHCCRSHSLLEVQGTKTTSTSSSLRPFSDNFYRNSRAKSARVCLSDGPL